MQNGESFFDLTPSIYGRLIYENIFSYINRPVGFTVKADNGAFGVCVLTEDKCMENDGTNTDVYLLSMLSDSQYHELMSGRLSLRDAFENAVQLFFIYECFADQNTYDWEYFNIGDVAEDELPSPGIFLPLTT